VLLVVLAVSPVTAPFAACDLVALVSDNGHTDTASKILKEPTTVATFVDTSSGLEDGTVVQASTTVRVARPCQTAPAILRL